MKSMRYVLKYKNLGDEQYQEEHYITIKRVLYSFIQRRTHYDIVILEYTNQHLFKEANNES